MTFSLLLSALWAGLVCRTVDGSSQKESIWDEIAKNKLLIVVGINFFDDAWLMIFWLLELISHKFHKIDFASNILKDIKVLMGENYDSKLFAKFYFSFYVKLTLDPKCRSFFPSK